MHMSILKLFNLWFEVTPIVIWYKYYTIETCHVSNIMHIGNIIFISNHNTMYKTSGQLMNLLSHVDRSSVDCFEKDNVLSTVDRSTVENFETNVLSTVDRQIHTVKSTVRRMNTPMLISLSTWVRTIFSCLWTVLLFLTWLYTRFWLYVLQKHPYCEKHSLSLQTRPAIRFTTIYERLSLTFWILNDHFFVDTKKNRK